LCNSFYAGSFPCRFFIIKHNKYPPQLIFLVIDIIVEEPGLLIANETFEKSDKFRIFGNGSNKSKLHPQRNYEQFKSEGQGRGGEEDVFYHSVQNIFLPICFLKT
jgi:hypothetical protein